LVADTARLPSHPAGAEAFIAVAPVKKMDQVVSRAGRAFRALSLHALIALFAVEAVPASATAQVVPTPGTPPEAIQRQITGSHELRQALIARIGASGMSATQVRQRLATMGYDPRTLDPWLEESGTTPPEPTDATYAALRSLGLGDLVARDPRPEPAPLTRDEEVEGLRVFGVDVFARGTSEFDPLINAALPGTYQLGPGDELVLVLSGQVEQVYNLPVTREGFVFIPQVGQVWVNGLTLGDLREQLYSRLASVYSGVGRGPGATTRFDVSIARTRVNQVYITGEVARPGAVTVSPLASVLNALYQAGGPTGNGSFREVRLLRNDRLVQTIDLYAYLLGGQSMASVRMEPGDVIFVPVHQRQVAVRGQVNREAIFELLPHENLAHLIVFAGGLRVPARTHIARLERYLSPSERREPGVDRVVINVDLGAALRDPGTAPQLRAGDELIVASVRPEVRGVVTLEGSVWREGQYGLAPGMRAWDLIRAGDGLLPDAYMDRAHISRLSRVDGIPTVVPFTLRTLPDGTPAENPVLQEGDVLRVLSRQGGDEDLQVHINGAVQQPQSEPFHRGMTLRDAIVRSGGLRRTADPLVEVARIATPAERAQGRTARIYSIRVDSSYIVSDEVADFYLGDPAALGNVVGSGEAATFRLEPNDRILVRYIPEFEMPRVVVVAGEVRYPASYTLSRREERLREVLLTRAGGLTSQAFASGFRLVRNGNLVDVDLPAVLRDQRHRHNLVLLPGDSLIVPEHNPVVTIRGAVNSPASILYRSGAPLAYYIDNAGGYARDADKGRTNVRYANGRGAVVRRSLLYSSTPPVEPGAVITVPFIPPDDRLDRAQVLSQAVQILASLATVALVVSRVR
jgi:polysaccharide biosynthesis/export protein